MVLCGEGSEQYALKPVHIDNLTLVFEKVSVWPFNHVVKSSSVCSDLWGTGFLARPTPLPTLKPPRVCAVSYRRVGVPPGSPGLRLFLIPPHAKPLQKGITLFFFFLSFFPFSFGWVSETKGAVGAGSLLFNLSFYSSGTDCAGLC